MTFDHIQAQAINVAHISVRNDAPVTGESFVADPETALETYLNRRFTAHGAQGELRAVIEQAQVTDSHKPSQSKVGRFFDVAGVDEYNVIVRLRLENVHADGTVLYSNALTARRTIRVIEHASIAEREKRQLEGLEILFNDLDHQVQRIVLQDMRLGL